MVVTAFFFVEIPLRIAIWGVVNCSISIGRNSLRETIDQLSKVKEKDYKEGL